jgi:hypothetical protein
MALLFRYSHEAEQFGPFSATQMRELAAAGTILATDLVWQDGTDMKVVADRVKNLFLPPPLSPPSPAAAIHAPMAQPPAVVGKAILSDTETRKPQKRPPNNEAARPKRVIRIRGGVIISQDGRSVCFAKQCETCGHKESGRSTAPIRVGMTRINFFCRPCRKSRTVELQGVC